MSWKKFFLLSIEIMILDMTKKIMENITAEGSKNTAKLKKNKPKLYSEILFCSLNNRKGFFMQLNIGHKLI